MTKRRLLPALAALFAATIAFAPGANAAPAYPPAVNGGLIIPPDIDVGEIHVLIGVGFRPNVAVTVTISREDRNGNPNVRGFAGSGSANQLGPFAAAGQAGRAAPAGVQGWKGHLVMACARAATCGVTADASGQVAFPIHFHVHHTHVVTVTGVHPDGTPRVLQEVIVPETDCDESDGSETEVADTGHLEDCADAGGVGGSGQNGGGAASGQLPNTGSSVGLPLTAGALMVLVGAGLVTVFRRRRRGDATA